MITIQAIDRELQAMKLTTPRVIILWKDEDVLFTAIELLLSKKTGWEVTRLINNWDDDALLQLVDETRPDVFIVHEDVFIKKMYLFTRFAMEFSQLKILTLSLENNLVNLYSRCTFSIREGNDLFSIIESDIHTI